MSIKAMNPSRRHRVFKWLTVCGGWVIANVELSRLRLFSRGALECGRALTTTSLTLAAMLCVDCWR